MVWRIVRRSIVHRRGSFVLTVVSVAVGAALVAALLGVAFAVGERLASDLRGFGANIVVAPRSEPLEVAIGGVKYVAPEDEAYLEEPDLGRLKTIFWGHNIVAFAPILSRTVDVAGQPVLLVGTWFDRTPTVPAAGARAAAPTRSSAPRIARDAARSPDRWSTGLVKLSASWGVIGQWPRDGSSAAMIGHAVAARFRLGVGDRIDVHASKRTESFLIAGIVTTGGPEDDQIIVDLGRAQDLFGLAGKVERVRVSALVTPDNTLAERARRIGADRLPAADYETWYCTPYLDSILFQIEEALPGARARALRDVSDTENRFLTKVTLTFALVSAMGLTASVLGVASALARTTLERRHEIGVMKAIGADRRQIALVFLLEAAVAGLAGGTAGGLLGMVLARGIGLAVFAMPIALPPLLLPIVLVAALALALAGAVGPLVNALRVPAVTTLEAT